MIPGRAAASGLLVIATLIWGFAFVFQKTAMEVMGPLTFAATRFLLGGLIVLPFALREYRRVARPLTRRQWALLGALSVVFFLAAFLQQLGLIYTTATNAGFLTSLYVLFVPAIAFAILRVRPHPIVWMCAPLAVVGIFYLNGGMLDRLNAGDGLMIAGAVFWALQVLILGHLVRQTHLPVFVSGVSFLANGLISLAFALPIETPTLAAISAGWVEILYVGVFSTAVAYTLQAIGQRAVPAANAAVILSGESLFAALGGALMLGERLQPIGYAGAALIFLAIVLVETIPALRARRRPA